MWQNCPKDIWTRVCGNATEYLVDFQVGCDVMTSDSNYNMKLPDDDFDDSNIYATDVVMLKVREKGASNN